MNMFLMIIIPILVLVGLIMMSRVQTAVKGNGLSIFAMTLAILATVLSAGASWITYIAVGACLLIGGGIGWMMAKRVQMIQMPQMVGLLNGLGGGASALVGFLTVAGIGTTGSVFEVVTGVLAILIGMLTLTGSLVAAGKLHRVLPQKPIVLPGHMGIVYLLLALSLLSLLWGAFAYDASSMLWIILLAAVASGLFGVVFAIRVGGADMPITISLLNSLSGVAGGIAGMAVGNVMLVAVGGIVGASGLLLTQVMCRAMNRQLMDILLGKSAAPSKSKATQATKTVETTKEEIAETKKGHSLSEVLNSAKNVIIVPGYGMALAQAQHQVKQLADTLERKGAQVRYAIHPVAGRMPGHMNVLLAEADVNYDVLFEMEAINDDFKDADLVVVIGANDVLNPAAREAEGTPIYGMPVLNVDQAKHVVICNFDRNPGYAGVPNPLYDRAEGVDLLLGDAKETITNLLDQITTKPATAPKTVGGSSSEWLQSAKNVIIVPGYGMALAQAQHQVKQLADTLERKGAQVRYAIHPVAGRMPGHMNVLLAEADVNYDVLFEMEAINDDFKDTDLVIVVGANDVLNPAAREAEGTPIYGMPVLNVDQAKHVVICNFDRNPGYAGVPNPLYDRAEGVRLMLGDAKESLATLLDEANTKATAPVASTPTSPSTAWLQSAKNVIIVPGYGMALAQAQHQVKQLADTLERKGAQVRYAIHPVAGRMPGHMNVLLAEADVDYDVLFEMEAINDDFKDTDLVIVVGANDVLNPAAREAEGTPIYGMPVLNVDQAKHVVICNFDRNPGYAGVPNPLYDRPEGVRLMLGDAKESLATLLDEVNTKDATPVAEQTGETSSDWLKSAKSVIIVPGYGMALAQAQHQVKQLADKLERGGAKVRYAIHPVAGRMPGHMNVLLAEADVDYDLLFEMEAINDDFEETDLVIVIGANDVLNPAAREAEGTPIYGMPVLNVDQAKHVVICNFDRNPGYAGVPNPLYDREKGVRLILGDAKESLITLISEF
ncbi:NAD(P)(+) transhydrogenase (Re/Si-specific) subunit beta [Porphyromonas cangingivalis]|uniref:proton-translocating NAD(P)(+) transhydrogenase n=1 Tax=Porphyromonas cangingivalis TaxID=36874 RepID=A0A1T4K0K3_PORCN|nr:NAD(P)(+) transhydrogenase (Re/Si-specific) subunit beta [Porphyromonas cangingivalis]SJZ36006.1 NAD(P) transhydrogenase subunit beta [Porphyromonas cangingivalis]VEJ03327.1 NAD(P) transhydrogenase subunit beta [Porphyromonas cangingivalis]